MDLKTNYLNFASIPRRLRMLHTITVLIFIIHPVITLSSLQIPLKEIAVSNKSEIYALKQNISTNNCQVMIDNMTLFRCGTTAYITTETAPSLIFTRTSIVRESIINGDIDDRSVIIVYGDKIEILKGGHTKEYIQFRNGEKNILARVKSKLGYILAVMLMENKDKQLAQAQDQKSKFFIDVSVIGRASNQYRLPFPAQALDFELSSNSFKAAAIFSDPYYWHDYIIIGLEKGWLIIFKTLLQNSEIKLIDKVKIEEDAEIIELKVADSFIFALLKISQSEAKIKVYRINTYGSFKLQEECTLYDSQKFKVVVSSELRVKVVKDWIILFVNDPGEKLIIFHFPRVEYGYQRLDCTLNYEIIGYSNLVPNVMIGYSIDYVIKAQSKDTFEQGIILSPLTENIGTSYFLPYCLPDAKWGSNDSCIKCKLDSDSLESEPPSICIRHTSKNSQVLKKIEFNQTAICSNNQTLTEECISCDNYMSLLGANLPEDGFWEKDVRGECRLKCKTGLEHPRIGACLHKIEMEIIENPCGQFYDCMNCSISQTCSWSGASCKRSEKRESSKNKTLAYWDDILIPVQKCGVFESCGQVIYGNSSGTIQFSTDNLYKHQFCSWKILPYEKHNNKIKLVVSREGLTNDNLRNEPEFYLQYYNYNITGNKKKFSFTNLTLWEDNVTIELIASEVTIFFVNQITIFERAKNFKIDYQVNPIINPFEDVVVMFRWIYYTVFLLALSTCAFTAFRDVGGYYRRKRFIQELRAIEIDDNHLADTSHHVIKIERILKKSKFVNRIVLDGFRKLEFNQKECIICLEEFSNGEKLAEFSCKHIFHVECFEKWAITGTLKANIKCPVCNRTLV